MEFMAVRSRKSGKFLCYNHDTEPYFDRDIRNAIMYDDESHAIFVSTELSKDRDPLDVVYVTFMVSNVRS